MLDYWYGGAGFAGGRWEHGFENISAGAALLLIPYLQQRRQNRWTSSLKSEFGYTVGKHPPKAGPLRYSIAN